MKRGLMQQEPDDSGPLFEKVWDGPGLTQRRAFRQKGVKEIVESMIRLPARSDGPSTSRDAALSEIKNGKIAKQIARVVELVRRLPGLSARELSVRVGDRDPRTINRRLSEAETMGLLRRGPTKEDQVTAKRVATWFAT